MNIFEYIDKKRNEYEMLRDENQLQLKTNCNRIQKITSQIKHMTEEEENPSQFFLPEAAGNYKEEIEKLQGKIDGLESANNVLSEKIELCEEELRILDTLELPDFALAEGNMAWEPMRVPEEEFQKKNVSRETFSETTDSGEESVDDEDTKEVQETDTIDKNQIKEKISFCRKFAELDPRRCSLLLDEIINEL